MNLGIGFWDIAVIAVYFVITLGIGFLAGRKNNSTDQYFLAGKSFPGWVLGISLIGSIISSVTFIGIPADSFKTTWVRFFANFSLPIVALIAAKFFVPFFRRGTITSAYQYLSMRFGGSVSIYAAFTFILNQIFRTSVISYLLALLLAQITGWPYIYALLAIVGFTAVYTIKGGLKAVVWTDVIQTFILVGAGLAVIVLVAAMIPGGFPTIFTDAWKNLKFSMVYDFSTATSALEPIRTFEFSISEKTLLMIFFAGFCQFLTGQLEQSSVQRWCSAKTAAEAKKSIYWLGIGCVPVWALFCFLGTCLYVFFLHNPDPVATAILKGVGKAEDIMPHFIVTYMPVGMKGLTIAGALAAAMSTLSACTNAASMVTVQDIYLKLRKTPTKDSSNLLLAKIISLVISLLMIGGAWLIYIVPTMTLNEAIIIVTAIITAGVPGVFLAGMFTKRASLTGAWVGLSLAILLVVWSRFLNPILPEFLKLNVFPYYVAIFGNIIAFAAAYLFSLRKSKKDLNNLTIWTQTSAPLE